MGQVVNFGRMVVQHFVPYGSKNEPIYGALWISSTTITPSLRYQSKVEAVEEHIENQQQVLQLLKDNLTMAQNRMKQQADQHHSERSFEVGDWVFFKTTTIQTDVLEAI